LAKLNLVVPLYRDKLFAGLEVQYHGAVSSLYGTELDDFWLLNTTLFSQKLVKGLEFTASVQNLLDQSYAYPGSSVHPMAEIPQLGRTFWLKLTYQF